MSTRFLTSRNTPSFEVWATAHLPYLEALYDQVRSECADNNVKFFDNIPRTDFYMFIYRQSSKYISPYL